MLSLSEKDRSVLLEALKEANIFWKIEVKRTLDLYPSYAQDLIDKRQIISRLIEKIGK